MLFLFKEKKIVVDCFTDSGEAYEYGKIDKAGNFYPKWLKKCPVTHDKGEKSFFPKPTIRTCSGLIDTYKHGMIIPMWSDLAFEVTDNGFRWQYSDFKSEAECHDSVQWQNYIDPKTYGHIKLLCPWAIKANSKVSWYLAPVTWDEQPQNNYLVASGMVDYYYNTSTNINMFIPLKNNNFIIPHGKPMVHIMPLSEKKIELRHHLVSTKERIQMSYHSCAFINEMAARKKGKP